MGEVIRLKNRDDGFDFAVYRVPPQEARRGGLIVLQAIWGVTPHLRELADRYADQGYEVLVPSLIDRFEPGFPEVDFDKSAMDRKMGYGARTNWTETLGDIQAAVDALAGPVFVVGFCWGGTAAWMAAAHCHGIAAVSAFYGHQIVEHLGDAPKVPLILHLGRRDELIPPAAAAAIEKAYPELPIFTYEAGHAFMAPSGHVPDAAELARLRTLQLFHRAGGARGEMGG